MIIYRNIFFICILCTFIGTEALEVQSSKLKAFEDAVNKAKQDLESINSAFGLERMDDNGRQRRGNFDSNNAKEALDAYSKSYNQQPLEYITDEERKYRHYSHDGNEEDAAAFQRQDDLELLSRKWKTANLLPVKYPKICLYNNNNPKIYKQLIKLTNRDSNDGHANNNKRKPCPDEMEAVAGGKGGSSKTSHDKINLKESRGRMKTCGQVFVDADFLKENLNKEYDEQKQRNDDGEDEDDYDNIDAYGLYVPSVPDVSCAGKYKQNEHVNENKQGKYSQSKDTEVSDNGAYNAEEIENRPKKYMLREGRRYIPQGWLFYHNGNRKLNDDSSPDKQLQQENLSGVQMLKQHSSYKDDIASRAALATASQINHLINDDLDSKSYLYRSPIDLPLSDQFETDKNNLSHEANYKLSKIEQDASEGLKGFMMKWGDADKKRRFSGFNPMNEIKLKTSQRLMTKGFGPSLPSYSLSDNRNEMLIEHVLQKKEEQISVDRDDYPDNENDAATPLNDEPSYNFGMGFNRYAMDALSADDSDALNDTDAWSSSYINPFSYVRQKRITDEKVTSLENSNDNKMSTIVDNVLLSLNNRDEGNANAAFTESNKNKNASSRIDKKSPVKLEKNWIVRNDVPIHIQDPSGDSSNARLQNAGSEGLSSDRKSNDQNSDQPLNKDAAQSNDNHYADKNGHVADFRHLKMEETNCIDHHQHHMRRRRSVTQENLNSTFQNATQEGEKPLRRTRRSAELPNGHPHPRSLFSIDRTQGIDNHKGIFPQDHGELNFLNVIERKKNEDPTVFDNQKQSDLKLEKYNNMKFDNLDWNENDEDTESKSMDNTRENEANDPNHKFSINFDTPHILKLDGLHTNLKKHNINYRPSAYNTHRLRIRKTNGPHAFDLTSQLNDNDNQAVVNNVNDTTNSRLDLYRWMHNLNRASNYNQKSVNVREGNADRQHANPNTMEQQLSKPYPNSSRNTNTLGLNPGANAVNGGVTQNLMHSPTYTKSSNFDAGKSDFFLRRYANEGIETTTVTVMNVAPGANGSRNCTEGMTTCIPICNPNFVTSVPAPAMNATGNDAFTTSEHYTTPTTAASNTSPNTTTYHTTTSTEYAMEGTVSTTVNPLTIDSSEQATSDTNECNDLGYKESAANCSSPEDNEVKINININAKISGQSNQKIACTNDSSNYAGDYTEDRDRRQVFLPAFDANSKPDAGDLLVDTADYERDEELNKLASGKLSSHVVKSVYNRVKDNPKFRLLWPSFKYMKIDDRPALVTDLHALRTPETNEKVDESEKMLRLALDAINTMIDEQVRSHTCVPLRPDLQKFYEMILKSKEQKEYEATRNKRHDDDSRSLYQQDLNDLERIEHKSKVVKKLLKQYEELPQEDQQHVTDVRDDLLENLMYLRKLHSNEERKKREAMDAKKMQVALANEKVMKRLESQYSPEFLRLLKASDLYYEILPENERNL